jgi:hypothetical protein
VRAVFKWLADASFAQRVDELRAQMVEATMGRLTKNMSNAARTLSRLLRDKDSRVRLGAAKAILESASKLRESVVLEQRVKALEAAEAARAKGRPR